MPLMPSFSTSTMPATSTASRVCGAQRVWVVLLFLQLLVGFILPLYVTYIFERRLKLRYLHSLQHDHDGGATASAALVSTRGRSMLKRLGAIFDTLQLGPIHPHGSTAVHWLRCLCFNACVLCGFAVLCWQLVVELHPFIARHVKLLRYRGADYAWYKELVPGGHERPCRHN
jgi:hypothetical protein